MKTFKVVFLKTRNAIYALLPLNGRYTIPTWFICPSLQK